MRALKFGKLNFVDQNQLDIFYAFDFLKISILIQKT